MKNIFFKRSALSACVSSAVLISTMWMSQSASAHGYLEVPPSRAYACQLGLNTDCGGAQYEPQSVGETFKGFPAGVGGAPGQGPVDGQIASGGHALFSAVDAQTATRWHITEIKDRNIEFQWLYTASHPASKHEYFITRNGWNPNQPLTRAQFESMSFCNVDGKDEVPVSGAKHSCVIPGEKSGHHVILAIWFVADTDNAFYNAVDVNIIAEADLPSGWTAVGSIGSSTPLLVGDKVKARAFTTAGEKPEFSTEISIDNAEEGTPQKWSFKLADKINQSSIAIRAGIRGESGEIEPIEGTNNIYAQQESGVTRYEVQLVMKEDTGASMNLGGVQPEYVLDKGRTQVGFDVVSNRKMNVEATLFDENNKPTGTVTRLVESGTTKLIMDVRSNPGAHTLAVIGTTPDGRTTRQDGEQVNMTGEGFGADYDFIFPEGVGGYKAGTKVLQPKTNEVFECLPWPVDGYCNQYTPTTNSYEPGVGTHWASAWKKL